MQKSNKNQALLCGVLGIVLTGISYIILGFLSIPGFILGVVAIVNYFKTKSTENEVGIAALVCGILACVFGAIGIVLMIMNVINATNAALNSMMLFF